MLHCHRHLAVLTQRRAILGREGVAIALSRISTQSGAAIDTFYVTDSATGNKITDSHRIAGLQKRLQSIAVREV